MIHKFKTEGAASRHIKKWLAPKWPQREFRVCQHPHDFGYAIAMIATGPDVGMTSPFAYVERVKAERTKQPRRLTCYDRGKCQIEIANTDGHVVTAVRVSREVRQRTHYWFRYAGANWYGICGDGTAFSAKEVQSIPR